MYYLIIITGLYILKLKKIKINLNVDITFPIYEYKNKVINLNDYQIKYIKYHYIQFKLKYK